MECVTEINEKQGGYHCFAIHLKEESSIVLGAISIEVQYTYTLILLKSLWQHTCVHACMHTEINAQMKQYTLYILRLLFKAFNWIMQLPCEAYRMTGVSKITYLKLIKFSMDSTNLHAPVIFVACVTVEFVLC